MIRLRLWLVFVVGLACMAAAAAPPLQVPHGRPGHQGTAGPSAIWQGTDGAFVIETRGDIAQATGNLYRRTIEISADGALSYAAQPAWDAAALLDKGGPRKLFTISPSGATLPFDWDSLPPQMRSVLDQAEPGAALDGLGALRTAFLRGDRAREQGQPDGIFRKRASLMGDIVNSAPLIVGPPRATIADSSHAAYRTQFKARPVAVYAGANDGMLHGFSADTGSELFAYLPAALIPQLPALAAPAYRPRPLVDGSPGAGDAKVGGRWRTVLASGMGMGARGVFALDITDPFDMHASSLALWEFSDADDAAMGHVREAPLIVRIVAGKGGNGAGPASYVVVPSGINNLAPDGAGALFLLSIDKPAGSKWQEGVSYFRIDARGPGAPGANALSAPALVVGDDGSASRAYAGDLHGNLWRFDFAKLTAHRLFTARGPGGVLQPIAHAPKVVHAPGGGFLVVFATGRLIEEGDLLPSSFGPQSVYAIHDGPGAAVVTVNSRAELAPRTLALSGAGYAISGDGVAWKGPDRKLGWYFDFPNANKAGERAAASPVSIADALTIASLLPGAGKDGAPASRLYTIDAVSGLAHAASTANPAVTGELAQIDPTLPLLFADAALLKGERGATGGIAMTRRVTLVQPQAAAGTPAITIDVRYRAGRMGWREVSNWQELHRAAVKGH